MMWVKDQEEIMIGDNQQISEEECEQIRGMCDFDLRMLLSEIHDHGWPIAKKLLPLIRQATEKFGYRREEPIQ